MIEKLMPDAIGAIRFDDIRTKVNELVDLANAEAEFQGARIIVRLNEEPLVIDSWAGAKWLEARGLVEIDELGRVRATKTGLAERLRIYATHDGGMRLVDEDDR